MAKAIIRTWSGEYIDLMNPRVDNITLCDISTALSRIIRWNGHTNFGTISVARHSVNVCNTAKTITGDKQTLLFALFHDAAEAYVGDIVSPLKHMISNFERIEANIMACIAEKFGFRDALLTGKSVRHVKQADDMQLLNEARHLISGKYMETLREGERGIGIRLRDVLNLPHPLVADEENDKNAFELEYNAISNGG